MTKRGQTHRLRALMLVLALLMGVGAAVPWIINRPWALRYALAVANLKSTWFIDVQKFSWHPLAREIRVDDIVVIDRSIGRRIEAKSALISYRLLGLLRGRLTIDKFLIEGAKFEFPPLPPGEKKERKRLNIAKLILLKNVKLEEGNVRGLSISFGRGFELAVDEASGSVEPTFFGDTKLLLRTDGLVLSRAGKQITSATALALNASTDLTRWHDSFPYLNDINGDTAMTDITFEGIQAQELKARASLFDGWFKLSDLKLTIGERSLEGNLSTDIAAESFDLGIKIARAIALPYIGKPVQTVDTAGELSGSLTLTGEGLAPRESNGSGRIELSYKFSASPLAPVSIASDVKWKNGVINTAGATVTVVKDRFSLDGVIDIPGKRFSLSAEGKGFPIENLFDKFYNPHLRKIFGPTDFKGAIEGWGKKFAAKVSGTVLDGGWKPITAQRADVDLDITYDLLKLKGQIFSGAKQTGTANLTIKYGPKIGELPRSKHIDFDAETSGQPLEESLAAFGLSGRGSGAIHIRGPHTAFTGEASAMIEGGGFYGLGLDLARAKIGLSKRQITFSEMALKLSKVKESAITGTITGDLSDGKLRLHGAPIAGLALDATYRYADRRWIVTNISWNDPAHPADHITSSGNIVSGGPINLDVAGKIDLGTLSSITPLIKRGSGPIDTKLSLRGNTGDPGLYGTITFNGNTMTPAMAAMMLEGLNGSLRFEGDRIHLGGVKAKIDDSALSISGYVDRQRLALKYADIAISGKEMRFRNEEGTLRLEFEGDISLKGQFPNPTLKGDITILDGRYTKDFTLIDALTGKGVKKKRTPTKTAENFDPNFDLHIRNRGDLAIRNNVGDIWLNLDVVIKGTYKKPAVSGSIEATEGQVHYLGMEFDITKGFVELREKYEAPYLEVHAQKEVDLYNVSLILHGPTDNLALDLSATSPSGPLEKRDVVSLILFGATEQERAIATRAGDTMATSIAGQAVTGIVGRPIQKLTHLDVFRLEAPEASTAKISRIYLGKQISDRLSINFATDIDTENTTQTVIGEYLVTDNIILSGARSSDSHYRIGGALRFRLR